MNSWDIVRKIRGEKIRQIYKKANEIAALHNVLTSSRGNYFNLKLLDDLKENLDFYQIERLRKSVGLRESHIHIENLLVHNLVELIKEQGKERYHRTELGEMSINAVRTLELQIGQEAAKKIFKAHLDPDSIRLFLLIFNQEIEIDFTEREVKFSPEEIVKLGSFIRSEERKISAIDKLISAALLNYKDGLVYPSPSRSSSLYGYLIILYIIITRGKNKNKKPGIITDENKELKNSSWHDYRFEMKFKDHF